MARTSSASILATIPSIADDAVHTESLSGAASRECADRRLNAEPACKIGELWAELSEGRCAFVMVKEKRWDWIEAKLSWPVKLNMNWLVYPDLK